MMSAQQIAARTAWGEARGEGVSGMQAVLNVIQNRVMHPGWWGRDIVSVCQANQQFSCWNRQDPNRAKLLSVTDKDPQFCVALHLAEKMNGSALPDLTGDADHYFDCRGGRPFWAQKKFYRKTIGHHAFYRVGLHGDGQ
ncbi:cell wall hydrolase [Acetobacter indonesiensis]|uniref:cell wall hydrolase n=1 Tax=Acetobacter indonesiensis TaxID=104101 RepID=UPI0039E810F9